MVCWKKRRVWQKWAGRHILIEQPALPKRGARSFEVPLLIGLALLTHLPYIGRLGYYWGDTFFVWMAHLLGADSMIAALSDDRPGSGILFALNAYLLGDAPLAWHAALLAVWILGGLAFYGALRLLFPAVTGAAWVGAALLLVYPGYLLHPQTVNLQNYTIALALALLSVWLSLLALRRRLALPAALVTMAAYLLILDIFAPLELMRWALLLITIWKSGGRWRRVTGTLMPYFILFLLVMGWRVFVFNSARPETDLSTIIALYQADFAATAARALSAWIIGMGQALLGAWYLPLFDRLHSVAEPGMLIAGGLGVGAGIFAIFRRAHTQRCRPAWALLAVGLAGGAVALALPAAMLQPLDLFSANNRYMLPAAVSVGLIGAGIWSLWNRTVLRAGVFAALIAVGTAVQLANANRYAQNWEWQRSMLWQLGTRAPALAPDTLLMATWGYPADNTYDRGIAELFYTPNLFYHYNSRYFGLSGDVLTAEAVEWIPNRVQRELVFRTNWYPFTLRYANSLIFTMPNAISCLRILDPIRQELPISFNSAQPHLNPTLRQRAAAVAPYSRIDLISLDAAPVQPPEHIFGAPLPDSWCYTFQRADLARQRADWDTVLALYHPRYLAFETSASPYPTTAPRDPTELLPFLEAFIVRRDHAATQEIASAIAARLPPDNDTLCRLLNRMEQTAESVRLGCR